MKNENTSIRLKTIMQETGLRQIDILNKTKPYCKKYNIKLGRNDLSQYLSGKVEPSQRKLSILAMALDVNEAWLMGYDVPREPSQTLTSLEGKDEIEIFKAVLKHKGFLNDNEELTEEDFNRLLDFAKANKEFIMKDRKWKYILRRTLKYLKFP